MEPIAFPRHINAPQRILFWTLDEVIPFSAIAVAGMVMEQLILAIIVGAATSWSLSRYRDSRQDGFLLHAAYWYGLIGLKGRSAINPFLRRILP